MFSVIIPTLWKSKRIFKLLDDLEACKEVGEIILIDNSNESSKYITKKYNKLNILNQNKNIFVNPAFNLGVSVSSYSNLCFSNDDINWDTNILKWISPHIKRGVIGQSQFNYNKVNNNDGFFLRKSTGGFLYGWGCLFFIHKSNYINIPNELNIFYGDNWLQDTVIGGTWIIDNLYIEIDKLSETSSLPEFFPSLTYEGHIYNDILLKYTKNE